MHGFVAFLIWLAGVLLLAGFDANVLAQAGWFLLVLVGSSLAYQHRERQRR